jgi:hypothetical protein
MSLDEIPIWIVFVTTCLIVALAIEAGFRFGFSVHSRSEGEKESPVSTIAGSVLGLLAFILAFTFGSVTDRFNTRKELVREEANAINTAYLRSAFLPEPDRTKAADLFREYLDCRLESARVRTFSSLETATTQSLRIHGELWEMAVANARKDMNSDVAALYIEAVNEVINFHALRMAVFLTRIPVGVWSVLYALIALGMFGLGYQTAIGGSKRSKITPVLAFAFAVVIALIASLDRPQHGFITVSHKPLEQVRCMHHIDSRINHNESRNFAVRRVSGEGCKGLAMPIQAPGRTS